MYLSCAFNTIAYRYKIGLQAKALPQYQKEV